MIRWPSGLVTRPIENWPGALTEHRERARFSAPLSATVELLHRELRHLCAPGDEQAVLQIALSEKDFRIDGNPRANAVPEHPGVILSLESVHGPLSYPCDTYTRWEDNLRAIALSLEALRRVDRYGVSGNGNQYRGWIALEQSSESASAAEELIREHAPLHSGESTMSLEAAYRRARKYAHPDRNGGDRRAWDEVEQAARILGLSERGER